MSRMRTVWITAARQVSADSHVFGCTYRFENMATLDLEHVATAPYRFSTRLRNEFGEEPFEPVSTRSICHRDSSQGSRLFFCMKLVPGGRFLLTYTLKHILQLWDFGLTPNASLGPLPLATITTNTAERLSILIVMHVQPTSDQSGILVLTLLKKLRYVLF
jgi:hypothetical protein